MGTFIWELTFVQHTRVCNRLLEKKINLKSKISHQMNFTTKLSVSRSFCQKSYFSGMESSKYESTLTYHWPLHYIYLLQIFSSLSFYHTLARFQSHSEIKAYKASVSKGSMSSMKPINLEREVLEPINFGEKKSTEIPYFENFSSSHCQLWTQKVVEPINLKF